MKYRLILFDFDGTLADSFPFLVRVFNELAERHGFAKIDPALVPTFRHYDAREMMRHVGLPAWKLPAVAKDFTGLMKQNAASVPLFEHVGEVLAHLAGAGVTLAIVSSNTEENIRRILGPERAMLIRHFQCGMSIFGKPARIRKVLRSTGVPSSEAIYIGDQVTDLQAARSESVALGAVAWGYGTIESLRAESPDEEFESVTDIKRLA